MPRFSYVAVDAHGQENRGVLEVPSLLEAIARINQMNLHPTRIVEADKPKSKADDGAVRRSTTGAPARRSLKEIEIRLPYFSGRVKSRVLCVFTRQLATLLQAGLPLLRSLRAIEHQEENVTLKRIIREIGHSVEGGNTFSEALAEHPKVFNRLYVNMVRAGELGGLLETVLGRLADFMEKSQRLKGKIVAAMFYPTAVLVVAVAVMSVMMVLVVPRFREVFVDLAGPNGRLPAFTEFVLGISEAVAHHFLLAAGLVAAMVVLLNLFIRTPPGRRLFDKFKLRMPIVGPVIRKTVIARFARTLGTLLSSGVPILQALTILKETAGNVIVGAAIASVHNSVKEGETITAPLAASGVFPSTLISMVDVGEQTGALPEMLTKIADIYEDEVDNAVAAMTALLEPIMIVVLAVVVGSIVIAMFLPIIEGINRGFMPDPGAVEAAT